MHTQKPKKIKPVITLLAALVILTLFVIPSFTLAPTSGRNQSVATKGMPPVPLTPSRPETQFAQGEQKAVQDQERARALFDIQIQSIAQEPPVMPIIMILAGILAGAISYSLYVWKIRKYLYRAIRRFRERSHASQ